MASDTDEITNQQTGSDDRTNRELSGYVKSFLYNTLRPIYNYLLRPLLPRKQRSRAGVVDLGAKLLDISANDPNWKRPLTDAICCHTNWQDHTIHIGGGRGTSIVMSARFGDVTVYEASERFAGEVRTTASLNGVADRVTVNHAIVGQAGEVWDEAGDAQMVDPGTLPDCDVLVLDCEGGETEVLPAIECTPHTIIVECGTAPHASIAEVRPLIEQQEYDIVSEREQGEQTVIEARSGSSRNGRDCALDLPVSETNGSSSRTE